MCKDCSLTKRLVTQRPIVLPLISLRHVQARRIFALCCKTCIARHCCVRTQNSIAIATFPKHCCARRMPPHAHIEIACKHSDRKPPLFIFDAGCCQGCSMVPLPKQPRGDRGRYGRSMHQVLEHTHRRVPQHHRHRLAGKIVCMALA